MIGSFNNRVTFYKKGKTSPEAFDEGLIDVFSCFCNEYDPTITDHELLDLNTAKTNISLKIRRNLDAPTIENTFLFGFDHGFVEGKLFSIISIKLDRKDNEFLKIVGQEIGE
ncbi:hypothetical protein [Staphylococcus equorum]|uniref:Phage head-tail adapter protein n=1 Tax=Staphylococcus equorum TaxID=246432 RepID=A0A9X4R1W1_9STAP|nr:hypothetical protein [Staphylococcus equorum]MDG0860322.1 hypothetical protein [Staphylococcus equorum]